MSLVACLSRLPRSFKTSSVSRPKTRGLNFNWGEIITWLQACIVGPLPVLCQSSHCSCLTGSSRDIYRGSKGVWTGGVPNQKLNTIPPWDHGNLISIRAFPIWINFVRGQCSMNDIVHSNMAVHGGNSHSVDN